MGVYAGEIEKNDNLIRNANAKHLLITTDKPRSPPFQRDSDLRDCDGVEGRMTENICNRLAVFLLQRVAIGSRACPVS